MAGAVRAKANALMDKEGAAMSAIVRLALTSALTPDELKAPIAEREYGIGRERLLLQTGTPRSSA